MDKNLKTCFFDPLVSQWVPEISHHCPRTPFLLVGTQVDLRDDSNTLEKLAKNKQRALTCESGEKQARELKAVKYVECSALTQVDITEAENCPTVFNYMLKGLSGLQCFLLTVSLCLCQRGLKNVFDEAILAALEPPDTKPKRRCILL